MGVALPLGGVARWRAGPSTVPVERRASDWRIWHETAPDAYAVDAERARRIEEEPPDTAPTARFSFAETPDTITVSPALADRPVIVRPESDAVDPARRAHDPLRQRARLDGAAVEGSTAPARQRVRPRRAELAELPSHRPSDTWFGPSTREGELCYAVRTAARSDVAELPLRPHRAVTPVTVENQAATPVEIVRIEAPMPFLALHVDRDGRLWTDGVLFIGADDDTRSGSRRARPTGGERLAEPRDARSFGQTISKTFSRLLRGET